MTQFDMRSIRKAPAAQISSKAESRKLFEGAETAANEHLAVPYSPIVLAGTVRMIELTLVALVGFAVYVAYVLPHDGFEWYYVGAIIVVRRWTRQGRLTRRSAIVVGGPLGEALACALASQRDSDVRVVGLFDDRSPQSIAGCVSSAMSTT